MDEVNAFAAHKRNVIAAVTAIKNVSPPYIFRLFMRAVDFGIERLMEAPAGGGINTLEMNVTAVEYEDGKLVGDLLKLMAIEPALETEWSSTKKQSELGKQISAMQNFHGLVQLMLAPIPCPGVKELRDISSIPSLVAHLAYNYSLRLTLFTMTTSEDMMSMMREDIFAAMACVEFLTRRLNLVAANSRLHTSWTCCKEATKKFVTDNPNGVKSYTIARDCLSETVGWIISEVATKVSKPLSYVVMHCHIVALLCGVLQSGEMPKLGTFHCYIEVSRKLPNSWFGKRYTKMSSEARQVMVTGLKRQLSVDVLRDLYRRMVCMSRNFIHQFEPDYVEYDAYTQVKIAQLSAREAASTGTINKNSKEKSVGKSTTRKISIPTVTSSRGGNRIDVHVQQVAAKIEDELVCAQTVTQVKHIKQRLNSCAQYLESRNTLLEKECRELQIGFLRYSRRAVVFSLLAVEFEKKNLEQGIVKRLIVVLHRLKLAATARGTELGEGRKNAESGGRIAEPFSEILQTDPSQVVIAICSALGVNIDVD